MYKTHQSLIAAHAQTPQGFADVVTFVIATENQHFFRVGRIVNDLRTHGLDAAPWLNNRQKRGITYTTVHAENYLHFTDLTDCDALRFLVEIPSIGIVKAGFILQLVAGRVGCLDRHNLKTSGLAPRSFNRLPQRTESISACLEAYVATCASLGGSEALYNGWCRLIASRYPQHFKDAEDVSFKHVIWCNAL